MVLGYFVVYIEVLEGFEVVRWCLGMYIGGMDECVYYYLFVEIFDNLMDEVVVGWVDWIEVVIDVEGFIIVIDNGCGILVDLYLKYDNKFVLEVVLIVLYVGGKFLDKVYKIFGGLYGVGILVVNVFLEIVEVEVVCEKIFWW